MKRNLLIILLSFFALSISNDALAKRLKIYSYPKKISAGQLGFIVFENPDPEVVMTQAKCSAEKLVSWVSSPIPIIRIEQAGKQIWTSLGSYQTLGDSCVATFMAPAILAEGPATLYLVNVRDASVPYNFTVSKTLETKLIKLDAPSITPLGEFRLVGDGFLSTQLPDKAAAVTELEHNVSLSKLDKGEQYTRMNKRMSNDWDRLEQGNFLHITQGGKEWRTFVEECNIAPQGMTLDFTAPPDLKPGKASFVVSLRMAGKEVARTPPMEVNVQ